MTAKSETVGVAAWLYWGAQGRKRVAIEKPMGWSSRSPAAIPLIPLADYERLLSGLEALAGRLDPAGEPKDRFDEGYDAACEMWRAQIRALIPAAANTESEETKL